jgi:tRNA U55 pseudouridine synthase TruB
MSLDIYIVGTNHPLQCGSKDVPKQKVSLYEAELRRILEKYNIRRISEEISPEGLERYKVTETVAQKIAKELDIPSQDVDLTRIERSNFSLDDAILFTSMEALTSQNVDHLREGIDELVDGVRERVWVARVLSNKEWPVLFICGSNHSMSIRKLIRHVGFSSKVEHIDYQP